MNMSSTNDPFGSFTPGTDKRIGDAFPVIEAVYAKLAELIYLANNVPSLVPNQIEFRYVPEVRTLEWKYSNEEAWNILVTMEDPTSVPGLTHAAGVPTGGIDGSFYFRQDGDTGSSIYMKRFGVWFAIA